ncbi:MAG: ABC transporter permease [Candidatus Aminicenantes bacterium]|nr:ABC transporter permease [Candidatus Aminicenantes bacterium]
MFKNYLKVTLNNLKKHKSFSLINILGLAIGLGCSILITSYVFHELSYDKYHKKADRIYRLCSDLKISGEHLNIPKTSPPMAEYLVQNYPEVLNAVRFRSLGRMPVRNQNILFYENRIFFADNSVFDIFTFPLLKGDSETALKTANSAVITEEMAVKYFGSGDPIGKVLNINNEYDFTITGVLKNIPKNSHFVFDILCSFETYAQTDPRQMRNWLSLNNYTYILLQEGIDLKFLENKLPEMIEKRVSGILKAVKSELDVYLQPITSIHLHSNLMQEISGNSSIVYVYIFIAISVFILAIACINYMNLSTARSANRAKEVGLRKVMGANRSTIMKQFLGESIFFCLISLVFALLLVELTFPFFKSLSGIDLNIGYLEYPWIIPGLLGLAVITGFIAGAYPAFFLSSFHPVRVIKGIFKAGYGAVRFRSALVVFQFFISIFLIIGTIGIFNQLKFMKNQRLGFQKEHIVVIPISDESTLVSLQPLKEELKENGNILSVAASSHVPGQTTYVNPFIPEGFSLQDMQYMGELYIDHDFIPTLGIELAAGRNFSPELQTDIQNSIIINETAAKKLGWKDPIGKTIADVSTSRTLKKRTVIGVVKDFHIESLHKKVIPLYIGYTTHLLDMLSVRIKPERINETISFLENKMKQFDPNRPFEYFFLDDSFDAQYRSEEQLSRIFSYFAILAIFIACLGLLGLASYAAEQKTKEIGIRKVLGASVPDIMILLSKQFTKWVLMANVLSWPIAYYSLHIWLQGFAYRTNITWSAFILSALISFGIALLTVLYQTTHAAVADPVKSLRYE